MLYKNSSGINVLDLDRCILLFVICYYYYYIFLFLEVQTTNKHLVAYASPYASQEKYMLMNFSKIIINSKKTLVPINIIFQWKFLKTTNFSLFHIYLTWCSNYILYFIILYFAKQKESQANGFRYGPLYYNICTSWYNCNPLYKVTLITS